MANGYLEAGIEDEIAYFDMFFRKVPDGGGFAIMAGIEQVVDYLDNLKDGKDYNNLFESAQARAIADWLVGMNISRLYSCLC